MKKLFFTIICIIILVPLSFLTQTYEDETIIDLGYCDFDQESQHQLEVNQYLSTIRLVAVSDTRINGVEIIYHDFKKERIATADYIRINAGEFSDITLSFGDVLVKTIDLVGFEGKIKLFGITKDYVFLKKIRVRGKKHLATEEDKTIILPGLELEKLVIEVTGHSRRVKILAIKINGKPINKFPKEIKKGKGYKITINPNVSIFSIYVDAITKRGGTSEITVWGKPKPLETKIIIIK